MNVHFFVTCANLLFAILLQAQTINIASNSFGFVFEDTKLNATNRFLITADLPRLLGPSTSNAVYVAHSTVNSRGISGRLRNLGSPNGYPKSGMPDEVKLNATNGLDIVVHKELSDEYLVALELMTNNMAAWLQAETFAAFVVSNQLQELTLQQANALFLHKSVTPGTGVLLEDIPSIPAIYSGYSFHMPSLLGYVMLKIGPNDQTYLWGVLPCVGSDEVSSQPMIYYQNQWWFSWWSMEPGEQQW